jgi:hypothetical protein
MVNIWWVIALITVVAILNMLSGWAVGYLVFRTKREQSDRLFPATRKKGGKPIIKDEFSFDDSDEDAISPIIAKQNERIRAETAIVALRAGAGKNG